MKTPNLLDVPKMAPSRRDKLKAFKAKHRIWTHKFDSGDEFPWDAILLNQSYAAVKAYCKEADPTQSDEDFAFNLLRGACRLMDEAEYAVRGKTERDAIEELCKQNNIPFDV